MLEIGVYDATGAQQGAYVLDDTGMLRWEGIHEHPDPFADPTLRGISHDESTNWVPPEADPEAWLRRLPDYLAGSGQDLIAVILQDDNPPAVEALPPPVEAEVIEVPPEGEQ